MLPCLTLSDIRYVSRVKWSNPGKRVVPPLHLGVVAIKKGSLLVTLDYGCQLYLLTVLNYNFTSLHSLLKHICNLL